MKTKLFILLLLCTVTVFAQSNNSGTSSDLKTGDTLTEYTSEGYKVVILSPYVGKTIDQHEKIIYRLVYEVDNWEFKQAQILKKQDGTYLLRVITQNGKTTDKKYSTGRMARDKKRIDLLAKDSNFYKNRKKNVLITAKVCYVIGLSIFLVIYVRYGLFSVY